MGSRSNPKMPVLKKALMSLARECIDGTHEGWKGQTRAPSLEDVEYLSKAWYGRVARVLFFAHLDSAFEVDEHIAARAAFVQASLERRATSEEARARATEVLVDAYMVLSGTNDEVIRRTGVERAQLGELGRAVFEDAALDILHDERLLRYQLRLMLMLTEPYRRFRFEDLDEISCDDEEVRRLTTKVHNTWRRRFKKTPMVALPHGPMSTLTRETANLGELVRAGDASWRQAGAKYHRDEKDRQLVLVFDQKLVLKDNGVEDTFLQVPLGGSHEAGMDPIGALTHALMQNYKQVAHQETTETRIANLVEDIPRVVAGMFRIAAMDRGLDFLNEGNFIDSVSGRRLAQHIGLNPDEKSSRNRVAAVRSILESIELSRSVRGEAGSSVTWTGPIIQPLKDSIEVSARLPDGLNRTKMKLGVWRIAPELWRMQVPRQGDAASFMLLDNRAFSLSARDSGPFNLYWTIIQRAYNTRKADHDRDRFDERGTFHPRFETLYTWGGLETATDRRKPGRVPRRLRKHLDMLVEHGLIEAYTSPIFELERFSLKKDRRRRVSITLPTSLLENLTDSSFVGKKNPFSQGHLLE